MAGAAETVDPADAFLELIVEPLSAPPFEQEMVLLTVRGFYRATISRQELEQPESKGYGWMQLGRDRWFDTSVGGRQGRGYERTIAIFPQRSGQLEIDPFAHQLTLLSRGGGRFKHEVRTEPLVLTVRPKPVGDAWWLPARDVKVTDSWDQPADQLAFGQTARRTVTLEVQGVGPELLPPIPPLRAPGVISFADPEERTTELTPEGPVSRVTWRWTVKPLSDAIGTLEAVTIPWFDTVAREAREIALAPQRVALAATTAVVADDGSPTDGLAANAVAAGLIAGFIFGVGLMVPGLRIRSRAELARLLRRLVPDSETRALRRAARHGDVRAVRVSAHRLLRRGRDSDRPHDSAIDGLLAPLDRSLFAPPAAALKIDLRKLVQNFLAASKSTREAPDR